MSKTNTVKVPGNFKPHPTQVEVLASLAINKYLIAGRRWGKTRVAACQVMMWIQEASTIPAIDELGNDITQTLTPPVHVWVVGPNYNQLKQVMEEFKFFIPDHMIVNRNRAVAKGSTQWETRLRLMYPNGQRQRNCVRQDVLIEFKSAENWEALQTVGLDVLYMTECQDIREEALVKVLPTLITPYRQKRSLFEGIPPDSVNHWFNRMWETANHAQDGRSEAFRYKSTDNPHIGVEGFKSILDQQASMTKEAWERMFLAKQPKGSGAFFRNILEAACLNESDFKGPEIGKKYVAGLDIGRRNSESVIIVKDSHTRESVYGEAFGDADWETQLRNFEMICRDWRVEILHFDGTSAGGDIMHSLLTASNLPALPFNFSAQSKSELYNRYAVALEKGLVSFPREWSMLIKQLQSVRNVGTKVGKFESDGGVLDDWVDAECLALAVCENDIVDYQRPAYTTYSGVVPTQFANGGFRRMPDGHRRSALNAKIARDMHEPSKEMWDEYMRIQEMQNA